MTRWQYGADRSQTMKPASSTVDTVKLRCCYIVVDSATAAHKTVLVLNSALFNKILLNKFLVMKEDNNVIFYILSFFLIIFPFERGTQIRKVSFKIFFCVYNYLL